MKGIEEEDATVPAGREHHPWVSWVSCQLQNDPGVASDGVEKATGTGVPDLMDSRDVQIANAA
jgi:hypothetical protein